MAMIGAHTDSPCLRIKPVSKRQCDGFMQVGVETYGGGLWHTCRESSNARLLCLSADQTSGFDRDLSIAGRVMANAGDGRIVQKLIKLNRPSAFRPSFELLNVVLMMLAAVLRIPTLAIHLDRQETFAFNKETQLFPIAGLVAAELDRTGKAEEKASEKNTGPDCRNEPLKALKDRHHPYIIEIIAEEAAVKPEAIMDFEIILYDTQKSCIGGVNNELLFSARLDNLMMSFCSTMGLIESLKVPYALEEESSIRLVSLFDHEEIGSQTAQGADSNLLPAVIRRLSVLPLCSESDSDKSYDHVGEADLLSAYEQTLATSFLISADMAHSVHPNYGNKYESEHRPEMNQGVVIKINANARYATNSPGVVLLQEVARKALATKSNEARSEVGVPLQLFVVRNDSPCGSTIGPMLSAALGVRTLDLGNPQLSMHSIRETGGVYDVDYAIRLFESFFRNFSMVQSSIIVD